jgi:hypothetical protein
VRRRKHVDDPDDDHVFDEAERVGDGRDAERDA